MITLSLLRSVEHFSTALSLPCSAAYPVMDCETGEKSAMARGLDLGGLGALDSGVSAAQGILNPLFWACKCLIVSALVAWHTSQHTNGAGFWGNSTRPAGSFSTGEGGVERGARGRSYEYIGALKIYWHCPVSRAVARVGEVGLTSWDSYRCPIKKRRSGGWRCGGGW
jgi:hypothetical protein